MTHQSEKTVSSKDDLHFFRSILNYSRKMSAVDNFEFKQGVMILIKPYRFKYLRKLQEDGNDLEVNQQNPLKRELTGHDDPANHVESKRFAQTEQQEGNLHGYTDSSLSGPSRHYQTSNAQVSHPGPSHHHHFSAQMSLPGPSYHHHQSADEVSLPRPSYQYDNYNAQPTCGNSLSGSMLPNVLDYASRTRPGTDDKRHVLLSMSRVEIQREVRIAPFTSEDASHQQPTNNWKRPSTPAVTLRPKILAQDGLTTQGSSALQWPPRHNEIYSARQACKSEANSNLTVESMRAEVNQRGTSPFGSTLQNPVARVGLNLSTRPTSTLAAVRNDQLDDRQAAVKKENVVRPSFGQVVDCINLD